MMGLVARRVRRRAREPREAEREEVYMRFEDDRRRLRWADGSMR
jgi:hypothetical protein